MKFLLVCNDFPSRWEPTKGIFNLHLARALAARHQVRVIAPVPWVEELSARLSARKSARPEQRDVLDGIEVCYPRYWYPPGMLHDQRDWFYWHSVRRTVRRILARFQPDAVLGYWVHPDGAVAGRIARLVGVPSGVIVGGSDVLLRARRPNRRTCVVSTLKGMDAILTVSQHLRERVVELGIRPEKTHVWRQGVDRGKFRPGDRQEARRRLGLPALGNVLVWVGRMVPVKGLDVLVRASAELRDRGVDYRLCLVGGGPLRGSLEKEVANRGLSDRITFAGELSPDRLPDWYRAANVTVLPSQSEGLPNVLRESLSCGTPFVASDVGGISEIARPGRDRLVPPGDSPALASSLAQALANDHAPEETSSQPASWEEAAESLVRIFSPLVNRSEAARAPNSIERSDWTSRKGGLQSWRQLLRKLMARVLPRRVFLVSGRNNCSSVCLTFDDGPHPEITPRLLDVLKREQVVATFFVVGQQAAKHPDLVRRMASEGHLVGHHSYSHSDPYLTSPRQLLDEIRATHRVLAGILGESPCHFRPPHGKVTAAKLISLWKARQKVVLWNVDPQDWNCQSPAELQERFDRRPLRGGDVVLLHDNRPYAVGALPTVIAAARQRGLSFGAVSQWTR